MKTTAKVTSLKDLKHIQQEVAKARAAEAARLAAQLAEQRAAQHRAEAQKNLFIRAVGAVQPLPDRRKVLLRPGQPPPVPVQQQRDEQAVLREAISDDFDAVTLLDTDESLSYRRAGIGIDVTRKLRKGVWSIQRELDLHGLRSDKARDTLSSFIREAHRQGIRCVRVVHGKGLGSPGKTPVLKGKVQSWLIQKDEVLAFVQARGVDGGAGALLVLLKPSPGGN
ncbi:MAG TPA: Smr/MutS family protein [Burkholderiaceae bacterium]|nr:Smr/MutS family protein [Burkholderiaceae bacterium]